MCENVTFVSMDYVRLLGGEGGHDHDHEQSMGAVMNSRKFIMWSHFAFRTLHEIKERESERSWILWTGRGGRTKRWMMLSLFVIVQ